jgi:hypothetical protein
MSTLTATQLQQQYIAYFGRPGDPAGIKYWLSSSSGISSAREFADKIYAQEEYKKSTVGSKSTEEQINGLYVNLFGRQADAKGLLYWTNQVENGTLSLSNIAYDLIAAASAPVSGNETQAALDATALSNKVSAATAYTAEVEASTTAILAYQPASTDPWSTGTAFTSAATYLSGITTTAHTAAGITAEVSSMSTTTNAVAGKSFSLTSNTDAITGGGGADTITGTGSTFNSDDSIDGGAGDDTFTLVTAPTGATSTIVNTTAVETIKVTNGGTAAQTMNMIGATGATDLGSRLSGASVLYTNAQTLSTVTAYGTTAGDIGVKYLDSIASGTADSITLIVDGGATVDNFEVGGTTASNEFETINIKSQGSVANTITDIEASDDTDLVTAKTSVVVTGDTKLTLGASGASLDLGANSTISAADFTGALVVYGDDAGIISITGGTGADTIDLTGRTYATSSAVAQSFTGGTGADTIVIDQGIAVSNTNAKDSTKHVYEAETLHFKEKTTAADVTLEVGAITGVTAIKVEMLGGDTDGGGADLDVATITGITTQTVVVDHTTSAAAVGNTDGVHVTAALSDATGTADSLTIGVTNSADDASSELGLLTSSGAIETVNLTATNVETYTIASLQAASAKTLNIAATGAGKLVVGTLAASNLAASTASTNSIIDASASTAKLELGDSGTAGFEASSITLTGGSNDDKFYFGTTLDSSEIVDGKAGTDTIFFTEGSSTTALKPTLTAEVLDIAGVTTSHTTDLSLSTVDKVKIQAVGSATTDEGLVFDNVPSTTTFELVTTTSKDFDDDTVDIGVATGVTNVTVDLTGTVSTDATNPLNLLTDAGKITINDKINDGTYYESSSINVGSSDSDNKLTSVVLTGGGALSATASAVITLDNENANLELASIDASGLESDLVVSGLVTTGLADDAKITLNASGQKLTIAQGDALIDQLDIVGGAGADEVVFTAADNATYRPGMSGVETLTVTATDASAGDVTIDLSDAGSDTTAIKLDLNSVDHNVTIQKASGLTSLTLAGTVGADKLITVGGSSGALTIDNSAAITDSGTVVDLTVSDSLDVTIDQAHASNIAIGGALTLTKGTKLSLGGGGKAGTITVGTTTATKLTDLVVDTSDGNISMPTVTAVKLANVTVSGDNTFGFGTTLATTTVLASLDASANTGAITIGQSVDFTSTADVKLGTAADTITLDVLTEGGLTLDAGEKSGTDVADTLTFAGINSLGLSVFDLGAADQITQLNGAVNAAVQKDFENINLASMTGTSGASITGSTEANDIYGTINSDTINITETTQKVDDIFYTVNPAAGVTGHDDGDVITGFAVGTDIFQITAGQATNTFESSNGTDIDLTSTAIATTNYIQLDNLTLANASGIDIAADVVLEIGSSLGTGTLTAAGFRAAVGDGGTGELVFGADDDFAGLVIMYDGTGTDADAGIFFVNTNDTAGGDPTKVEATDTVAHIATLVDVGADNVVFGNFV